MEIIPTHLPINLRSRKYDFRIIERPGKLRLVPLRWSAFTWVLFVVMLFFFFFVYKGLHIDVLWLKVVVVGSCTFLATAFLFGIFTQFFDGVVITADSITYRYGLARRSIPMDRELEVQLRQKVDRWVTDSEEQVHVTMELWVVHRDMEYHLFEFHGHSEDDAVPMQELGERLKTTIQAHVK